MKHIKNVSTSLHGESVIFYEITMYIFCEEYENIEKNYQILFILNLYFTNFQITP